MEFARSSLRMNKKTGRHTGPIAVQVAPLAARNKEVEELKKENERIKSDREARMQQFEHDTANMKEGISRTSERWKQRGGNGSSTATT